MANGIVTSTFSSGVTTPQTAQQAMERTFITNVMNPTAYRDFLGFTVFTGIAHKLELGAISVLGDMLTSAQGCSPERTQVGNPLLDRSIELDRIGANLEQCADVFNDSYFEQFLAPNANRSDLRNGVIAELAQRVLIPSIASNITKLIFCGSKVESNNKINAMNGLFVKFEAGLPSAQKLTTGSISTVGDAIAKIRALYNAQPKTMKSVGNTQKRIVITDSFMDGLVRDLSQTNSNSEAFRQVFTDVAQGLTFMGIPIIAVPDIDVALATYFGNSTAGTNPNQGFITTVGNIHLGTDADDNTSFVIDYDPYHRVTIYDLYMKMAVGVADFSNLVYTR